MNDREWFEITRRNARSVQTTIGWIFWDPGAVARLRRRSGLPGPLGYIAARAAPLAPAGPDAVDRRVRFDQPARHPARVRPRRASTRRSTRCGTPATRRWSPGCAVTRPRSSTRSIALGPALWPVVEQLPTGRPRVLRRAPAHAATRRSAALGLARGELPARVARRHALGARRRGRARPASRRRSCTTPGSATSATGCRDRAGARRRRSTPRWASLAARGLVADGEVTAEAASRCANASRTRPTGSRRSPWQLLGEEQARAFAARLRAAVRAAARPGRRDRRPELPARLPRPLIKAQRAARGFDDLARAPPRLEHLDEVAEATQPVHRRVDVLEREHDAAPSVLIRSVRRARWQRGRHPRISPGRCAMRVRRRPHGDLELGTARHEVGGPRVPELGQLESRGTTERFTRRLRRVRTRPTRKTELPFEEPATTYQTPALFTSPSGSIDPSTDLGTFTRAYAILTRCDS